MNMMAKIADQSELCRQAGIARALGSPFVADVLEASHRQLRKAPRTADLFANWPCDPSAAALAMRFNGALHALARRGMPPALKALYRREHDDYDGAIGAALVAGDDFIAEWMRDPPQTNEVGRAAAIGAALMVARRKFGLPFELLELGSSCGLNLNLARYAYDLGGLSAGTPDSPVRIAPEWRGSRPACAPIEVLAARGVDLKPLDAGDEKTRERLLSFVWADQPKRARRLQYALAVARRHPPRIDRADAPSWLAERLASPQETGRCRVVFHSMVLQYLTDDDRAHVLDAICRAGAEATLERPLAWIAFEWTPERSEVRLSLTCWPTGETRTLAICHPYGDWIDWRG
ncbi:DUF2332 domain-containing protein [Sphingosinicella sp. BN140058]|uniref:DUF2332 domain-containing protein n=1 Tax=Sphingosinicella sp. BN140058 TaxID=1892855 RepID=UPI0010117E98|nr:DUF2332 family protein [Sphingosinicella sp. BN140058]QAY77426.1 DUF2332 family protein [Sphingosinicella sp. BN140058]